jgi:hypothetical protein
MGNAYIISPENFERKRSTVKHKRRWKVCVKMVQINDVLKGGLGLIQLRISTSGQSFLENK